MRLSIISGRCNVGRNVFKNHRPNSRNNVGANPAKLMHQCKTAKNGVIMDLHVTGQRAVVSHYRVIPNLAVVSDVHVGHNPVVVCNFGDATVLCRSTINRAKFTYGVVISND